MTNINTTAQTVIPRPFKVLSLHPEIFIKFKIHILGRIWLFILGLPFLALFVTHCAMAIWGIGNLLLLNFQQAWVILSYGEENIFFLLFFVFWSVLLGTVAFTLLSISTGPCVELHASTKSLSCSGKPSISASRIIYFNHYRDNDSGGASWNLEAVSDMPINEREVSLPSWLPSGLASADIKTRLNYRTLKIHSHHRSTSTMWLGQLLADFYHVEFRSSAR